MAGSVDGGRLTAQTNKERYDDVYADEGGFYAHIGRQGGYKSRGGGFALTGDPETDRIIRQRASEAGAKGGIVHRTSYNRHPKLT